MTAELRDESGTSAARRLRRTGWLPGVIYNEKCEARSIRLRAHELEVMLSHHHSENLIVDIEIKGEKPRLGLVDVSTLYETHEIVPESAAR